MKELLEELARRIEAGESANEVEGKVLDTIWSFCEKEAINRMAARYQWKGEEEPAFF